MAAKKVDVEGFVHRVSDLAMPAKTAGRYFHFVVQERDESRRVVCFSPEKRNNLKRKEDDKSPVRLVQVSPQKRKFAEGTEYKLEKYSKVEDAKNVSFPWKDHNSKFLDVASILEEGKEGEVVSLKAVVLHKSEVTTIFSNAYGKKLRKCDLVVADASGSIELTVWEDLIAHVIVEKVHKFKDVKVALYRSKCLNTNTGSTIVELPDEKMSIEEEIVKAAMELVPNEKETSLFVGNIVGVEVNKAFLCVNCKSKLVHCSDKFIKCKCCKLSMLSGSLVSVVTANVIIAEEGEIKGRFFCSEAVIDEMFKSVSEKDDYNVKESVKKLSEDMITETLLLIDRVKFTVSVEEKVVLSMRVA